MPKIDDHSLIVRQEEKKREDIFRFLSPSHGVVLDLGCGEGWFSMYWAKTGVDTVGIDISIRQLKRGESGQKRIQADASKLPFNEKVFDYVICSEVLEHLVSPAQCIREIHRVLKVGGIACLTSPCLNAPFGRGPLILLYRKLAGLDPARVREHLHVFSSKQLLAMLEPLFEIIDVRYPISALATIERRLGIGHGFAELFHMQLLNYFGGSLWIKVAAK